MSVWGSLPAARICALVIFMSPGLCTELVFGKCFFSTRNHEDTHTHVLETIFIFVLSFLMGQCHIKVQNVDFGTNCVSSWNRHGTSL